MEEEDDGAVAQAEACVLEKHGHQRDKLGQVHRLLRQVRPVYIDSLIYCTKI